MSSSTLADATSHLLLGASEPAPAPPICGVLAPGAAEQSCSSPAGLHRRPWLGRLRAALLRDEFVLHYQPIVSLHSGRISHHEALVRLADERDGTLVAPASFLPAAERYGLICAIDRLVVDRVAAVLAGPTLDLAPTIAINLSGLSVTDGGMLDHIAQRLALHGVDPARLVIEITETASISDMERARAFCAGARELGCAIALDDFGAGFGSFQYLKQLPFDYLKIDGDFIRRLPRSPKDQLVVKALVGVVRGMGARTVAEFVGDGETQALLRAYGVDYAQGFQVGHPRPALLAA